MFNGCLRIYKKNFKMQKCTKCKEDIKIVKCSKYDTARDI